VSVGVGERSAKRGGLKAAPAVRVLGSYGVLFTFAIVFLTFAVLRPETFPTSSNMASILSFAVIQAAVAVGLTIPLIMNDFDLSVSASASLGGAIVVVLTALHGVPTPLAIALALAAGALVGVVNGVLITMFDASSLILTLATGSVVTGIEFLLTGQKTIFTGLPESFTTLGSTSFHGVTLPVFFIAVVVAVLWVLTTKTTFGRYIYSVGSNAEAARIVGLPVSWLRILGLIGSGMLAVTAGIVMSAISGNYSPGQGSAYLLPAFAAAFLGSALFPARRFSVVGAAAAALLLQMVATGLVQLQLEAWTINVFNGVVLGAAILMARRAQGSRRS
jgi:ribose transport system permease protein